MVNDFTASSQAYGKLITSENASSIQLCLNESREYTSGMKYVVIQREWNNEHYFKNNMTVYINIAIRYLRSLNSSLS